jgi:hypothetical protein
MKAQQPHRPQQPREPQPEHPGHKEPEKEEPKRQEPPEDDPKHVTGHVSISGIAWDKINDCALTYTWHK